MTLLLTPKQLEAGALIARPELKHVMLYGGSRSGKTFVACRTIGVRALKAPGSRHLMARFRTNAIRRSIYLDTWPKVLRLAFPGVVVKQDRTEMIDTLPNGSEVWFAGLDDKDRLEKILGQEFATVYLNESSQISYEARTTALTRLAQNCAQVVDGVESRLRLLELLDCNPPSKAHWSYRLFHDRTDPESRLPLANPGAYGWLQMNPADNAANLPEGYIDMLSSLGSRIKRRFVDGQFADANPNALWRDEIIDRWRVEQAPATLVRVVVAVDPSGADDEDAAQHDEIGIVVAGLGLDGVAYVLEDCTIAGGPATWGRIVASAFDRHAADCVVGEVNYGGAMVKMTVQVARPRTPFKAVVASRGKHLRAEPISALYETGMVRHVGQLTKLEDELCAMSTVGYTGPKSPNRADAAVFALAELFPGVLSGRNERKPMKTTPDALVEVAARGWMGH